MPSPFPGMDPFIESQCWEDFHHHLIEDLYSLLVRQTTPQYVVRVEARVYIEHAPDETPEIVRPDVTVLGREGKPGHRQEAAENAQASSPVVLTLPMPEERREAFLTIRSRETLALVTILEVLSLANKRRGGEGRQEYIAKRMSVLQSDTHLVELDLLRGGERLPTIEPLPSGDYYVFVSREHRRHRVEVYPCSLRQPLPRFPVPLAGKDPDVVVDLQQIFSSVYERARYLETLDYHLAVLPALREADEIWARGNVRK